MTGPRPKAHNDNRTSKNCLKPQYLHSLPPLAALSSPFSCSKSKVEAYSGASVRSVRQGTTAPPAVGGRARARSRSNTWSKDTLKRTPPPSESSHCLTYMSVVRKRVSHPLQVWPGRSRFFAVCSAVRFCIKDSCLFLARKKWQLGPNQREPRFSPMLVNLYILGGFKKASDVLPE